MTTYWAEYAMLPTGVARDVRLHIAGDVFDGIETGVPAGDARRLPGVVLPGLANTHSHAFHRALRGRTHADGGTFWSWREAMYGAARRLDPDNYFALARATYAEMALSGITSVGEFHYLHHNPDGTPYDNPNAMGEALQHAAREAGVRLTLLDTCYLAGGLTAGGHQSLSPDQVRFGDGDVSGWAKRVSYLEGDGTNLVGAAIHSVRAVPRDQVREFVHYVGDSRSARVVHAHVSEQPAENDACRAFYGMTPVQLLADAGALDRHFTAVHGTHLTAGDIQTLGDAAAGVAFCPTTERDLADGIGPSRELLDAGVRLSLGSDQHAVIDMFEEIRGIEADERLRTLRRGRLSQQELLTAATAHDSIGWEGAGRLEQGAKADLIAVDLESPRTAGVPAAFVLTAATVADVTDVVRDGETVVADRRHHLGDVGRLLQDAIDAVWER